MALSVITGESGESLCRLEEEEKRISLSFEREKFAAAAGGRRKKREKKRNHSSTPKRLILFHTGGTKVLKERKRKGGERGDLV